MQKKILLEPYFFNQKLIEGACAGAERHGLVLSVAQQAYFKSSGQWKKFDGLLSCSIAADKLEMLQQQGCKILCMSQLASRYLLENADAVVASDELQVCAIGASYLFHKGFSHFACCLDRKRETLFRRQLREYGIEECISFAPSPITQEVDLESRIEFIRKLPKPCAFIVQTVLWSERWHEVIFRSGVRVPEELSILGIDNLEYICNLQSPRLSAIDTNGFELGFRAVDTMARLLAGEAVPRETLIPPQKRVFERESSDFYAIGNEKLRRIIAFSRTHLGEKLTVRRLAGAFSMTVQSLDELFLRHLRNSPKRFLVELQLKRAEELLKHGDLKMEDVARESGFATVKSFYDFFHEYHDTTPKEWCCRFR